LNKDLIGLETTTALKNLKFNSKRYEKLKISIKRHFFTVISLYMDFKAQAEMIDDSEVLVTKIECFSSFSMRLSLP
jgi:hypothetical protein